MTTTPKMALAIATRAVSSLLSTYVVLVDSLRLLYYILPSSILCPSSGSPRMSRPRVTKGGGSRDIGTLFDIELWWREQYRAIQGQGYILRPRYHPDWRPSWKRSSKAFYTEEDGQPSLVSVVCLVLPIFTLPQLATSMDATRASDGRQVMFKIVPNGIELEINQFFSSPGLIFESDNHCVPLLDTLELPDEPEQKLIVMPFLRPFDDPRFQTFGEFVSFFSQICDVSLVSRLEGRS